MDERLKRKLKEKQHPKDPMSADLSAPKQPSEHHGLANGDETQEHPAIFKGKSEELAEINNKPHQGNPGDAPEDEKAEKLAGADNDAEEMSEDDLGMLRAHHMKHMRG